MSKISSHHKGATGNSNMPQSCMVYVHSVACPNWKKKHVPKVLRGSETPCKIKHIRGLNNQIIKINTKYMFHPTRFLSTCVTWEHVVFPSWGRRRSGP